MRQFGGSGIAYRSAGGIAEIVLARPAESNVFTLSMADAFADAVWQAGGDESVRAVLVSAAGDDFCWGGDFVPLATSPERASYLYDLARALNEALEDLAEIPKPVIAAVQGAAAGIGLSIVLAADVVISARTATYMTAFAGAGLTPMGGLSWHLPRVVGQRRALELTLTGRVLSAEEGRDWGLVTTVVDDEELMAAAQRMSGALASGPAFALGQTRRLIRSAWAETRPASGADEARTVSRAVATPEARAVVEAFTRNPRGIRGSPDHLGVV